VSDEVGVRAPPREDAGRATKSAREQAISGLPSVLMADASAARRWAPHAWSARLSFAVVAAAGALLLELLLTEAWDISSYAILVGAVALSVWYGGIVPGLLCAALSWAGAIAILVADHGSLELSLHDAWIQWGVALGVALGMIWVSALLRRGRARATEAAEVAEQSAEGLETLQRLSSALSAAATVSDVVATLVQESPAVVGAPVALGFAEDGEIVIAPPRNFAGEPWQVERLTEGRMLHRTATEGRTQRAIGREEFEATFPKTAALALGAEAAIAVPLRVEGRVIGSIGFVFDDAGDVEEDAEALAELVAGLGGQALERARLFEIEQESRRGLDRILRVAPRFFTGSEPQGTDAICREARTVFGSDIAMLWRVEGDKLELSAFDPPLEPLHVGLEVTLADFPQLRDAVGTLNISFVPDVREEARGAGLARVRALGIHSSLRVPVVIAGEAELVLIVSWQTHIASPDASTLVLVRRFADQAGLALEQLERRRAVAEATRRAVEARRLHDLIAALVEAATPRDVGTVCLEHASILVGADGGFLVRTPTSGSVLDVVARLGGIEPDGDLELTLDSDEPAARAVATGQPVWGGAVAPAEGEEVHVDPGTGIAIGLPLRGGARVLGAVQLTFDEAPNLSSEARSQLASLVSQCALALERSFLLDSEHRLRRFSERLQTMTAELSNALTRADVANVLLAHVEEAVGSDSALLALVDKGSQLSETLAWHGYDDDVAARWLQASLDADTPVGEALRRLAPQLHHAPGTAAGDVERFDPAGTGHASFLFVPLVLGWRPMAMLVASSSDPLVLDSEDMRLVGSLAGQAAQALERARQFESEQTIAETLQRSVLPASLPELPGIQLAGRYLPGTAQMEVGGDWFDAIHLQNGRLALVVGDVVGKGVNAAATMGQLRNAIRAFSLDHLKPTSILSRLTRLADEVIETSFATLVYAELDPVTGVCRYASAGHPPPLAVHLDGSAEFLDGGRGLPLGTGLPSSYRQGVAELPQGSLVLLYTDGLIERRGQVLDEGLERLRQAAATGPWDPDALVDHVIEQLVGRDERRDDIVLLAARRLPVAPRVLDLSLDGGSVSLRHARDALRLWLAGTSADEMSAHDIVLAAWEACANATEHGRSDRGFGVQAKLAGDTVRIVVTDNGTWVPPAERSGRGRGLALMRALVSSVEVDADADGTRVTLEKRLVALSDTPVKTAR
jgi:serine phosphatase RsbU (regulator of sigma subunit)/anti-sigma regulatory factor (Ser/Thr protein kinase)